MMPPERDTPGPPLDEVARWRAAFQRIEGGFERFYEEAQARIADLKRRESFWDEKLESLIRAMERERSAWMRAIEEERGQIQGEYLKARLAHEQDLARRFQKFEEKLEAMAPPADKILGKIAELAGRWEKALETLRPPLAKEAAIAALEAERAELLEALNDKEAAFQSYMSQRRGFEKTLGERLLELERRYDAERQKGMAASLTASDLEARNKTSEERLAIAERSLSEKDEALQALSRQNSELLKRLGEEAQALRQEIEESRKVLRENESKRAKDEEAVAALTVELQKVSAAAAAARQEKEETVASFASWAEERKNLQAALAEKDELLRLFEAYFKERG